MLTQAEQKWAQIEKETLSVVFGLERFDQYTIGRKVHIQNDHKPLATILKKPLSQASRRIQALMMWLHRYDVTFQYVQSSQLFIAYTLNRAFLPGHGIDVRVMAMNSLLDIPDKTTQEVREATKKDKTTQEVREATKKDPVLQTLLQFTDEGWPARKSDVPEPIRLYFDIRDTLSHQDGIILKGEGILIPLTLRSEMKKRLHSAHLGCDSMLR